MKLFHVSDTHGDFPKLIGRGLMVCHSGDFFPHFHHNKEMNIRMQENWLEEKIDVFRSWVDGRPFIFCPGNHDYADPIPILKEAGINALGTMDKLVNYAGLSFYGVPYIPFIEGKWNYELNPAPMEMCFESMEELFAESGIIPDILFCHAPPFGIFDRNADGQNVGNRPLLRYLDRAKKLPRAVFMGHVHEDTGVTLYRGALLSQAATVVHCIDV